MQPKWRRKRLCHIWKLNPNFAGRKDSAKLDFCKAYWQSSLHPSSYSAWGIITPQGTYVATPVLHGPKNAATYFQKHVLKCFQRAQDTFKAWIDGFVLYAQTEAELLNTCSSSSPHVKSITWYYRQKEQVQYPTCPIAWVNHRCQRLLPWSAQWRSHTKHAVTFSSRQTLSIYPLLSLDGYKNYAVPQKAKPLADLLERHIKLQVKGRKTHPRMWRYPKFLGAQHMKHSSKIYKKPWK